jgi:hypothetical protein
MKKLMPMGTQRFGRDTADLVELEGFGIVGAVIDLDGSGVVLHAALTQPELLLRLKNLMHARGTGCNCRCVKAVCGPQAMCDECAARAAIAQAEGGI